MPALPARVWPSSRGKRLAPRASKQETHRPKPQNRPAKLPPQTKPPNHPTKTNTNADFNFDEYADTDFDLDEHTIADLGFDKYTNTDAGLGLDEYAVAVLYCNKHAGGYNRAGAVA